MAPTTGPEPVLPFPNSRTTAAEEVQADLQRIRWAGWALAAVAVTGWAGWISLATIQHQSTLERLIERQTLQYEQLREAITELQTR